MYLHKERFVPSSFPLLFRSREMIAWRDYQKIIRISIEESVSFLKFTSSVCLFIKLPCHCMPGMVLVTA